MVRAIYDFCIFCRAGGGFRFWETWPFPSPPWTAAAKVAFFGLAPWRRCCSFAPALCTSFKFYGSNDEFELRHHFTCDTMNVLYVLTCPTCHHNYIGQTERAVRDRCGDHRRAISDPKYFTLGVHQHLATCGKGSFTFTPFLKIQSSDRGHSMILSQEGFFIKKFKPSLNESKLGN